MNIEILPSKLAGAVSVPTSKSIGHRVLFCSFLATGQVDQTGLTPSQDMEATVRALSGLQHGRCDCGESGSTLRFIIPVALALGGEYSFAGRGRLLQRPLEQYYKIFDQQGIRYHLSHELSVKGKLRSGHFCMEGNVSSQFVTGLLLALPLLKQDSVIEMTSPLQSKSYVDMTLWVQKQFGVVCKETQKGYIIAGNQRYTPANVQVEGDDSQAAFWLVANALGSEVSVTNLNPQSVQGDRVIASLLANRATQIDIGDCPDLAPALGVYLSFTGGKLVNAARLRYKESDRLIAVRDMLCALGGQAGIEGDTLCVNPVQSLRGGIVDSFADHRIAMAAAVAASRAEGPVIIRGAECVEKSYPDFWKHYKMLGGRINEC